MDIYEGIQSEIVSSTRFNENSNLSTTYLGRVDKENINELRAEESFPISEHGYNSGRLLEGTECPSCQNHSTCNGGHSTLCQNLPQGLKEYK